MIPFDDLFLKQMVRQFPFVLFLSDNMSNPK